MIRVVGMALLLLTACAARSDFTFGDISVTLPDDTTTLPPGPHVDIVSANCTGCHSPATITTQPRLTRAAWEGEVAKMIKVYKAPVAAADVPAIVDYLAVTNAVLTPVRSAR